MSVYLYDFFPWLFILACFAYFASLEPRVYQKQLFYLHKVGVGLRTHHPSQTPLVGFSSTVCCFAHFLHFVPSGKMLRRLTASYPPAWFLSSLFELFFPIWRNVWDRWRLIRGEGSLSIMLFENVLSPWISKSSLSRVKMHIKSKIEAVEVQSPVQVVGTSSRI